jgi:hypothetical protein
VFAVWEPILPTDYSSPGTAILARLSDPRVTQYWDKNHLFAEKLGHKVASDAGQPQPKCCTRQGIQWDEVAVYPPDASILRTVTKTVPRELNTLQTKNPE